MDEVDESVVWPSKLVIIHDKQKYELIGKVCTSDDDGLWFESGFLKWRTNCPSCDDVFELYIKDGFESPGRRCSHCSKLKLGRVKNERKRNAAYLRKLKTAQDAV